MKAANDRELLDRFVADRDESAFAELVSRHGSLVMGVCRRVLGNVQDAEDAFQATFVVLSKKAPSIRTLESVSSWLHCVAVRIAIRAKSLAGERRARERRVAEMAQSSIDSPGEALPHLRPVIDEALSGLPEKYRAPLVLCYLEGKTNEGAAQILGWPMGTMSRRLDKARELLRSRLVGRGVAITGAALAALLMEKTALAAAVAPSLAASAAKVAVLAAAGEAAISAPVALLVQGGLKAMFAAQLKVAGAAVIAVTLVGTAAAVGTWQALTPAAIADAPGYSASDVDRLDRRLAELQPTAAERKIDRIGWAPDLPTAVRLSKEQGRPHVVVVHDGDLGTGRFDGGALGLRTGSFADDRVISLLNRAFVPVYLSNEDFVGAGKAGAAERAARERIYHAALAAKLPAGDGAVYVVAPDGAVLGSLVVPAAHDVSRMLALLERFVLREGAPLVKPGPQSRPPAHRADDLVLHLVARYVDGNGAPETHRPTYHELPAENWIVLDRAEAAKLLPPGEAGIGEEWTPSPVVAAKILSRFYPVTEDILRDDVHRSRVERISLRARVVSIREGLIRARLDGQVRMQRYFHAVHPPTHAPEPVSADLTGFLDVEPGGRILSLKLLTTRASYGPSPFAAALQSK